MCFDISLLLGARCTICKWPVAAYFYFLCNVLPFCEIYDCLFSFVLGVGP